MCAALLLVAPESEAKTPLFYWGKAISGAVVDADTKQPLDGVIIVAQWVYTGGARLHVVEVVTDRDGKYHVPAWGPKPRNILAPRLSGYFDPQILCFKPGYELLNLANRFLDNYEAVRTSDWDGKTVEMKRFRGSVKEWAERLSFLQGYLGWGGTNPNWRQYPRMVLAVLEEVKKVPEEFQWRLSDHQAFVGLTEEELRTNVGGVRK
jgi:hypothetical protein